MSRPGSRAGRLDQRERQLQERVAAARARLDTRAADLGSSVDRIVNPIQALRRVPLAGIAAGLATGVAGGLLLSALRTRRTRRRGRGAWGGADGANDEPAGRGVGGVFEPGLAGLVASVIPLLVTWMTREKKDTA